METTTVNCRLRGSLIGTLAVLLSACAAQTPLSDYKEVTPAQNVVELNPAMSKDGVDPLVARGEYMTRLIGCASCHTDGALVGDPNLDRWMAGSRVGIAYSNPADSHSPAIVFPANLTPDMNTGIGSWSDAEIAGAIRAGARRHGMPASRVMPWFVYSQISDEDVAAIVAYLRSLPPVSHDVPYPVAEGTRSRHNYVHFGVYQKRRN